MSNREYAIDLQLGDSFRDMVNDIVTFVPKFIAFLVVFAIGWMIAKILGRVATKLLHRVKFDSLMDRTGLPEASKSNFSPSDILGKIVYYGVLLIALTMALGVFGPNAVSDTLQDIVAFIPKLIVAMVMVLIAFAVAGMARELINRTLGGLSYGRMLGTVAWVAIAAIGTIAALNQIGVATSVTGPVLIAVLATVGGILVVGLGGGLIKPMASRWESWLDAAATEARNAKAHIENSSTSTDAQSAPEQSAAMAQPDMPARHAAQAGVRETVDERRDHGLAG